MSESLFHYFKQTVAPVRVTTSTNTRDTWTLYFDDKRNLVRVDSAEQGRFENPRLAEDCVFLYQVEEDPAYKKRLTLPSDVSNGPLEFVIRRNMVPYQFDRGLAAVAGCMGLVNNVAPSDDVKLRSSLAEHMRAMAAAIESGQHIPAKDLVAISDILASYNDENE
jgi:hypothetical protein